MPEGSRGEAGAKSLRDYALAAWRWKWLIVGVAVACAAAAYYYSWRQAPQYEAVATLTYQQPVDLMNPLVTSYVDPSVSQLALENVVNVLASPTVEHRALEILGGPPVHAYEVSTDLNAGSSSIGYTNAANISVVSGNAAESAAIANAYAQAVIEWSREYQLARVNQSVTALTKSLQSYKSAASRRSEDYLLLSQRLQDLRTLGPSVSSEFQVLVPATPPAEPFAPNSTRSAVVGFFGGFLGAAAIVMLLEVFSTGVRGRADVSEALGLAVLGVIPETPRAALSAGRLVTMTDSDSATSEAFRLLRSGLDYANVDGASSLLVTSCLAGEGKTTTVCNLAVTLAMAGKKVLVVDGDVRKPRVHDYFGIPNDTGLSSMVAGTVQLADALRPIDLPAPKRRPEAVGGPSLDASPDPSRPHRLVVLTSGPLPPDPGELVASERFAAVMAGLLKSSVEFILVDSPALLEVGDAAAMAASVQGLLMVVDADKVGRPTLHAARDLLAPLPCHKLGLILVRAKDGRSGYGHYGHYGH